MPGPERLVRDLALGRYRRPRGFEPGGPGAGGDPDPGAERAEEMSPVHAILHVPASPRCGPRLRRPPFRQNIPDREASGNCAEYVWHSVSRPEAVGAGKAGGDQAAAAAAPALPRDEIELGAGPRLALPPGQPV